MKVARRRTGRPNRLGRFYFDSERGNRSCSFWLRMGWFYTGKYELEPSQTLTKTDLVLTLVDLFSNNGNFCYISKSSSFTCLILKKKHKNIVSLNRIFITGKNVFCIIIVLLKKLPQTVLIISCHRPKEILVISIFSVWLACFPWYRLDSLYILPQAMIRWGRVLSKENELFFYLFIFNH